MVFIYLRSSELQIKTKQSGFLFFFLLGEKGGKGEESKEGRENGGKKISADGIH
jgi:hypothetical protein